MMTSSALRLPVLLAASLALTAAPAVAEPDACAALDAPSFAGLLGVIDQGITAAETDFAANGETGLYPLAAQTSRDELLRARERVVDLQDWMASNGFDASNDSTAGGIHLRMGEVISLLQSASHWGLVSAIFHQSVPARSAFERAMEATERANTIGTTGGHCYLRHYLAP